MLVFNGQAVFYVVREGRRMWSSLQGQRANKTRPETGAETGPELAARTDHDYVPLGPNTGNQISSTNNWADGLGLDWAQSHHCLCLQRIPLP